MIDQIGRYYAVVETDEEKFKLETSSASHSWGPYQKGRTYRWFDRKRVYLLDISRLEGAYLQMSCQSTLDPKGYPLEG